MLSLQSHKSIRILLVSVVVVIGLSTIVYFVRGALPDNDLVDIPDTTVSEVAQYRAFSGEILEYSTKIRELGCAAGDQMYFALAQDYKYIAEYEKSLRVLESLTKCFPQVFEKKTPKGIMMLNNIGDLYETWANALRERGDVMGAWAKYDRALEAYRQILGIGGLSDDQRNNYTDKIQQIEKNMPR